MANRITPVMKRMGIETWMHSTVRGHAVARPATGSSVLIYKLSLAGEMACHEQRTLAVSDAVAHMKAAIHLWEYLNKDGRNVGDVSPRDAEIGALDIAGFVETTSKVEQFLIGAVNGTGVHLTADSCRQIAESLYHPLKEVFDTKWIFQHPGSAILRVINILGHAHRANYTNSTEFLDTMKRMFDGWLRNTNSPEIFDALLRAQLRLGQQDSLRDAFTGSRNPLNVHGLITLMGMTGKGDLVEPASALFTSITSMADAGNGSATDFRQVSRKSVEEVCGPKNPEGRQSIWAEYFQPVAGDAEKLGFARLAISRLRLNLPDVPLVNIRQAISEDANRAGYLTKLLALYGLAREAFGNTLLSFFEDNPGLTAFPLAVIAKAVGEGERPVQETLADLEKLGYVVNIGATSTPEYVLIESAAWKQQIAALSNTAYDFVSAVDNRDRFFTMEVLMDATGEGNSVISRLAVQSLIDSKRIIHSAQSGYRVNRQI